MLGISGICLLSKFKIGLFESINEIKVLVTRLALIFIASVVSYQVASTELDVPALHLTA
jgi:hypothetical protein